jgi:hypothetical protein
VPDQELGLGARDEHPAVNPQVQVAKAGPADDVRHRLRVQPAADEGPVTLELLGRHRTVVAQIELQPTGVEDVREKVLRREAGLRDAPLLEELRGRPEQRQDRPPPRRPGTANA